MTKPAVRVRRGTKPAPRKPTIVGICLYCAGPRYAWTPLAAVDPYCSGRCCRLDHGIPLPTDEKPEGCAGCGCSLDTTTPDCINCRARHRARNLRKDAA